MRDFKTLAVWQKAHRLTLDIYQSTEHFPKEELYGLTSQIRRACASIPMNIAEGCGRSGDPEFAHFLSIAMGSASELEYQLLLTRDLGLLNQSDYDQLEPALIEVKRMLNSFVQKLRANS
jgi:four helix bundle protein